jgi:hypothetical protein
MNSDKTDLIILGSHVNLARLATHDCSLQIGSDTIVPETVVRVLGVQLDAELSMKAYINHQDNCELPVSPAPSATNSTSCWRGCHGAFSAGFHNIAVGLLQLVTCRFTKVLPQPTPASAECRRSVDISTRSARSRDPKPYSASLVACPIIQSAVQAVFFYALYS